MPNDRRHIGNGHSASRTFALGVPLSTDDRATDRTTDTAALHGTAYTDGGALRRVASSMVAATATTPLTTSDVDPFAKSVRRRSVPSTLSSSFSWTAIDNDLIPFLPPAAPFTT